MGLTYRSSVLMNAWANEHKLPPFLTLGHYFCEQEGKGEQCSYAATSSHGCHGDLEGSSLQNSPSLTSHSSGCAPAGAAVYQLEENICVGHAETFWLMKSQRRKKKDIFSTNFWYLTVFYGVNCCALTYLRSVLRFLKWSIIIKSLIHRPLTSLKHFPFKVVSFGNNLDMQTNRQIFRTKFWRDRKIQKT